MALSKRIVDALQSIGLHPARVQDMAALAASDPALANRLAEAASISDEVARARAIRTVAAEAQWSRQVTDTARPAPTPRQQPPAKLGEDDALRRAVGNELGPIGEGPMPQVRDADARLAQAGDAEGLIAQPGPQPDFQMDLPPSRPGDTLGDVPDAGRANLSEATDVTPGSAVPSGPMPLDPPPGTPPIDELIARLGAGSPPVDPFRFVPQAERLNPGGQSMDAILDGIDARRASQQAPGNNAGPSPAAPPRDMPPPRTPVDNAPPPRDMPPPRTPDGPPPRDMPGARPEPRKGMSRGDMAKMGVAGGVIGAGLAAPLFMDSTEPKATAAPGNKPLVPNVIKPPKPMSTADLAAETRPPPKVEAKVSPRDRAMAMIDDLNARRRKAGGEVPDAPQTMREINRLLSLSNNEVAAQTRGEVPVTGNSPREQAIKLIAQLNDMRRRAGGEVPQAQQIMAEVRRLQAMADQQANARRSG